MARSRRSRRGRRYQSSLSIGDSFQAGREPVFASRRSSLLPRPIAVALAARRLAFFQNAPRRVYRRPGRAVGSMPPGWHQRRAISARRVLSRPLADRYQNPCVSRSRRREVLHAAGVAGKSWRKGGPNMRGARRTVESFYVCRR